MDKKVLIGVVNSLERKSKNRLVQSLDQKISQQVRQSFYTDSLILRDLAGCLEEFIENNNGQRPS